MIAESLAPTGIDSAPHAGSSRRMLRALAASLALRLRCRPPPRMVGGARRRRTAPARAVVMIVGSRGTSCTGVALARDLVLTAAHCVLPGADYKLVEFDAARQPALKDIATHRAPSAVRSRDAAARHRVTADVALIKLAAPLPTTSAGAARAAGRTVAVGDRFVVAGYGVAVRGDGKSGGTLRAATLVATGQPGTLQIRLSIPRPRASAPGSAPAPAIPARRCFATPTARSP